MSPAPPIIAKFLNRHKKVYFQIVSFQKMCSLKSPIVSRPVVSLVRHCRKSFKHMPKICNEMIKLKKNYTCMVLKKKINIFLGWIFGNTVDF